MHEIPREIRREIYAERDIYEQCYELQRLTYLTYLFQLFTLFVLSRRCDERSKESLDQVVSLSLMRAIDLR